MNGIGDIFARASRAILSWLRDVRDFVFVPVDVRREADRAVEDWAMPGQWGIVGWLVIVGAVFVGWMMAR